MVVWFEEKRLNHLKTLTLRKRKKHVILWSTLVGLLGYPLSPEQPSPAPHLSHPTSTVTCCHTIPSLFVIFTQLLAIPSKSIRIHQYSLSSNSDKKLNRHTDEHTNKQTSTATSKTTPPPVYESPIILLLLLEPSIVQRYWTITMGQALSTGKF